MKEHLPISGVENAKLDGPMAGLGVRQLPMRDVNRCIKQSLGIGRGGNHYANLRTKLLLQKNNNEMK